MKAKFMLLTLSAFLLTSCASSYREPSSVAQERDTTHQKFQGYFDRPVQ